MAVKVALSHCTQYRYSDAVRLGPHVVRLRPAPHCRTPIAAYSMQVAPRDHFINWQQDPFGNFLARIVVPRETNELSISVDLVADIASINSFDFFVEPQAANWPFTYDARLTSELQPYLEVLPSTPLLATYLETLDRAATTIAFVMGVNRALSRDIGYRQRMEAGVQTPEQTLASRSGSCRDTGWLLVQILRRFGIAARFVSGYLIQLRSDDETAGADGPAEDSADLHAWAEVYIPGAGWIGLDPTSGLAASEGHIPLAATPSPVSAAPIEGTHGKAQVDFSFSMRIERLREAPRVARPYSEEQWQNIDAAGRVVEDRLKAADVRLSMGGEPTFVAAAGAEAPEWNIAALGPTKRGYADKLARGLRARFARGGLLHYGLGKWYPGEPAARWAYGIYWRSDGEPLWRDTKLIASEQASPAATIDDTARFAAELCRTLGLPAGSAFPAYEDAAHFALIEQRLPSGVAPGSNTLTDPVERARLVRVFSRGLDSPVGYVLPLLVRTTGDKRVFVTERWSFRREHLFLVPGDSPIGLRLPLTGLPDIDFVDYPHVTPIDPFADARKLPASSELLVDTGSCNGETRAELVRTALAVELRDGYVSVFLPPLADAQDYAALIAAIEATAARTERPVSLEGYAPPPDQRLNAVRITPDPGVIEVNVHPATSWGHAVDITTAVFEEAVRVGLKAEKFKLDGRRAATGGGNHIVVGGITPADSPVLRRPDLLASIITFWNHHPSLSFMFAGQFVGPTSQAPRADEARHESLYELEIALQQVPEAGGAIAPWLVDRLFRNLLVDLTGNTHRVEICIDKLYSPDGAMGRLGLVEFRAFEMPPHPRMSLVQQLLIRALVARFWERPYRQKLVRWGTTLHDRFMLPRFLWADIESVVADLRDAGFPFDVQWFAPHFEFRFPVLGAIERAGVTLELRQALEPWLVLGEQGGAGTTRTVDSSLDRVQVLVKGASGERYRVACNERELPLAPTGVGGEQVAGVRYRAWRTSEGLHPNIPPHVPLTFDLVDAWSGRSIGGCRYHATPPGGGMAQALPVNAQEAEARRRVLFEPFGHSQGGTRFQAAAVHPDFPLTLDLRRVSTK